MAWTSTDLQELEKAIASGTLSVKYSDKTVQYRSLEEMLKIRDLIRKELGLVRGKGQRIRTRYKKGL